MTGTRRVLIVVLVTLLVGALVYVGTQVVNNRFGAMVALSPGQRPEDHVLFSPTLAVLGSVLVAVVAGANVARSLWARSRADDS